MSADEDSILYTEINAPAGDYLQDWVDLASSDFLTYDFTVTANPGVSGTPAGPKNITVHVSNPVILSPNTTDVPGFTGAGQSLDSVYGQSGQTHAGATKYAIIALYSEETDSIHYKLVSDATQTGGIAGANTSMFGQAGWNVYWDINW